jgi:hypothetical protein
MIADKKEFGLGLALFTGFWVLFAIFMSPVFAGKNLLDYMDGLYNSISKNSSYYIPAVKESVAKHAGTKISFTVKAKTQDQADRITEMLNKTGEKVTSEGVSITFTGDMGKVLTAILDDADLMFANNGTKIVEKYGKNERLVVFEWWNILKIGIADLNKRELFAEGKVFHNVMTRGVEPAYNYYQIEAEPISNKVGIVVLSLAGYVVYTLWFGFAILFMFEGWGIRLEH